MPNSRTFCVIPAFNEEKTIVQVIKQITRYLDNIIVVDDGSDDDTFRLAKAQGVTVLQHLINRGQGAALETGNRCALARGADIIVHFDADGQFLAEEISELTEPIAAGQADITFGSRFLGKKSNLPKFKRYFIIPLAHLINKIFIGASLTDPQNGFRAMSGAAARKIIIRQDGMAHCTEIIYQALINEFKIKEVPVTVIYRNFGQRFSGGLKIIKDLFFSRLIN